MYSNIRAYMGGLTLISLTACSTLSGGPDPLSSRPEPVPSTSSNCIEPSVKQSVQEVLAQFECTPVSWLSGNSQSLKIQRNNVVTLRMYLIGKRYDAWERRLVNETREGNFGTTLALLGLNGLGAVVKQGATSRGLAATAAIVTGGKESFNRDILFDRTIPILMTQMRANRARVKELILKRLNSSYEEWPIGLAMADLEDLEHAGTVNSALMAVAESASVAKQTNENRAEQAITTVAYDESVTGQALQDYLESAGDNEDLAQLRIDNVIKAAKDAGFVLSKQQVPGFAFGNDPRKVDVLIRLIALEKKNKDQKILIGLAAGIPDGKKEEK